MTRDLHLGPRATLRLAPTCQLLGSNKCRRTRADGCYILPLVPEGCDELKDLIGVAECLRAWCAAREDKDVVLFRLRDCRERGIVGDDADVAGHAGHVSLRVELASGGCGC